MRQAFDYIKISRNKYKRLIGLFILLIPFLIFFINTNRSILLENKFLSNFSIFNPLIQNFSSFGLFNFLIIKIIFIFLPFISLTAYEMIHIKGELSARFNLTSISKVKNADKFAYSDLWYFLMGTFGNRIPLFAVLITLGYSNLNNNLSNFLKTFYESSFLNNLDVLQGFILIFGAITLSDLMAYIKHYVDHKMPILWDGHEAHHSAKQMTGLSVTRFSPLGTMLSVPFFLPINIFTGIVINYFLLNSNSIPFYTWLVYEFTKTLHNILAHSSVKIIYPKPISYFLMSPAVHWLHHSDNEKHYDCNFGLVTPIWDMIFGTYLSEKHINGIKGFGVKNSDYNKYHPAFCYTLLPIIHLYKRFKFAFKSRLFKSLISFNY